MFNDIEKSVEKTDLLETRIDHQNDYLKQINEQRVKFIKELDLQRHQLKEYEKFFNENRGQRDRELIELKKEVTTSLDGTHNTIKELEIDRRQLRAMVRN